MEEKRYETALTALRSRLSVASAAHCERVAATARELAVAYEVDPDICALAGLLHDWDRDLNAAELLATAERQGLEMGPADRAVPYLLHARTAAATLAEALDGVPDEVLAAVSRHTVGSAVMSDIDMVVYLADMMEPTRSFAGVEKLRDAVGDVPLAELFALGYQRSMMHLVESRRRIHPDTVVVWNAYVAGGAR